MSNWFSLTEAFTSHAKRFDATEQSELRVSAMNSGAAELMRALGEGRLPGESWRGQAACRGHSEVFFPRPPDEDHERFDADKVTARVEFARPMRITSAKKICQGCPVRPQCAGWALRIAGADKHAILGGTTASERKQIVAWARIELQGGHPMIIRLGWPKYRRWARAFRGALMDGTEPQPSARR